MEIESVAMEKDVRLLFLQQENERMREALTEIKIHNHGNSTFIQMCCEKGLSK